MNYHQDLSEVRAWKRKYPNCSNIHNYPTIYKAALSGERKSTLYECLELEIYFFSSSSLECDLGKFNHIHKAFEQIWLNLIKLVQSKSFQVGKNSVIGNSTFEKEGWKFTYQNLSGLSWFTNYNKIIIMQYQNMECWI